MKSLFSLDWFKSQRKIELEKLQKKEQKLKNKLLEKQIEKIKKEGLEEALSLPEYQELVKPYKSLSLVNNVITVVLNDNTILSKTDATSLHFYAIKNAVVESEVIAVMSNPEEGKKIEKEKKEIEDIQKIKTRMKVLKTCSDFKIENDSVYLVGVDRSMPKLLVERFLSLISDYKTQKELNKCEEYNSLKKFWLKCCLNPNAQSAEDLYKFLSHHQFKIDSHGNFYAYRRVVSRGVENKNLIDFITNSYNKVKAVWKKSPNNYYVILEDDGSYSISLDNRPDGITKVVGNLTELYLGLPNMSGNSYTSSHTGQEDYKAGTVISMPRYAGDDNNNISCSKGFHAASKAYNYSGFGDTPILVIVNPMDVLAVPIGEVGKLRTCRWFFAMTLTEEEEHILDDNDFDVTTLGDVFEEACNLDIENYVHSRFSEEVKRHTFTIPEMSSVQIKTIVKSLKEMKNEIKKRVQKIV